MSLTPPVIKYSIRQYYLSKHKRTLDNITRDAQQKIVFILRYYWNWRFEDIAAFIKISRATAYRHYSNAEYFAFRNIAYASSIHDLVGYILYNA